MYLFTCLFSVFGLLFYFKYFNFFNDAVRWVFTYYHKGYPIPATSLLLPVGISFFTFESVSYVLDVYYEKRSSENSFLNYAVFIAFFPKLLAGPIERSTTLLPQIEQPKNFSYNNLSIGIKKVLWGLFKKAVIADRIAHLIDIVYQHPEHYSAFVLLFISYLFVFQIYCDFSGYSDMAIGTARILGFRLIDNFNLPFFSRSILEFWRRWHISLSSLLRDYLYTPVLLFFARKSMGQMALVLATFITFLSIGMWHGANWTYVLFGLVQATGISYEIVFKKQIKRFSSSIPSRFFSITCMLITFHFTVFSFIFIKAESVRKAFSVIQHIFDGHTGTTLTDYMSEAGRYPFRFTMLLLVLFLIVDKPITQMVKEESTVPFAPAIYGALLAGLLLFGVFHHSAFIYFQF